MKVGDINKIFKVSTDKTNVICPPDQVFVNPNFDFLLTIGGDLIEDEKEYDKLIEILKRIGETEFYIRENIGISDTDRMVPFEKTIIIKDTYQNFQRNVRSFEPPFGWSSHDFYINGQQESWGIYICEYPTINIIGCDKKLTDAFRQVFSINKNGYEDLKEFIGQEYQTKPDYLKKLLENYRLNGN